MEINVFWRISFHIPITSLTLVIGIQVYSKLIVLYHSVIFDYTGVTRSKIFSNVFIEIGYCLFGNNENTYAKCIQNINYKNAIVK